MKRVLKFILFVGFFFIFSSLIYADDSSAVPERFDFIYVQKLAESLSKVPYKDLTTPSPEVLKKLSYSQCQMVRFKLDHDLWVNEHLPFSISFFPVAGKYITEAVEIYEIQNNKIEKIPFNPDFFDYDPSISNIKNQIPTNLGYAGFKVRVENVGKYPDEFAVFLGKSYFRLISHGSTYGLSARGIAIDTGLADKQEEFPGFQRFWIVRPDKNAKKIEVYALLNGESITGAYEFTITPGQACLVNVKSVLFLRKKVEQFGLCPMTSMYWFGENMQNHFDDFRPEVHNSDGLIVSSNDSQIWTPLVNYPNHKEVISDFHCDSIDYFGLLQRDRNFDHYQDIEVKYHLNPNLVVIPDSDWGSGIVRLIQMPTNTEWFDNINTFWVPDKSPKIGVPYTFNYTISCSLGVPSSELAYVDSTRTGTHNNHPDGQIFVVTFKGKEIENLLENANIEVKYSIPDNAQFLEKPVVTKVPLDNSWRVVFTLKKPKPEDQKEPFQLECCLVKDGKTISETWHYNWYL